MPYTEAVLLETLRVGNIAQAALPHVVEKDIVLDGKVSRLHCYWYHYHCYYYFKIFIGILFWYVYFAKAT